MAKPTVKASARARAKKTTPRTKRGTHESAPLSLPKRRVRMDPHHKCWPVQPKAAAEEPTPAAPPVPYDREAVRLSADDRRRTWYVLRCGEQWMSPNRAEGPVLSKPTFALTDNIADAWRDWQLTKVRGTGELQSKFYLEHFKAPLHVEQVKVTVNGLIVGSEPVQEDEGDSWGEPAWLDRGLYNVALAEAAAFEADGHGEQIRILRAMLSHTHMWPLLRARYAAELDAERFEGDDSYYKDSALQNVAARLFYAGVVAGRREQGRKNVHGDLILDAPGMPYGEDD